MSSVPVSEVTLHLLLDMADSNPTEKIQTDNIEEKLAGQ
jgi:hypothetical protein